MYTAIYWICTAASMLLSCFLRSSELTLPAYIHPDQLLPILTQVSKQYSAEQLPEKIAQDIAPKLSQSWPNLFHLNRYVIELESISKDIDSSDTITQNLQLARRKIYAYLGLQFKKQVSAFLNVDADDYVNNVTRLSAAAYPPETLSHMERWYWIADESGALWNATDINKDVRIFEQMLRLSAFWSEGEAENDEFEMDLNSQLIETCCKTFRQSNHSIHMNREFLAGIAYRCAQDKTPCHTNITQPYLPSTWYSIIPHVQVLSCTPDQALVMHTLQQIPEQFTQLEELEILMSLAEPLTAIPAGWDRLPRLNKLTIHDHPIATIPSSLHITHALLQGGMNLERINQIVSQQ